MNKFLLLFSAIAILAVSVLSAPAQQSNESGPQFTKDNELVRPDHYREWIWLSSGLGMSYGCWT
jgi:hypothetical protein